MASFLARKRIGDEREWIIIFIAFLSLSFMQLPAHSASLPGPSNDEGKALMEVKQGLSDPSNNLHDWDISNLSRHCNWQGVTCDNLTLSVIALNLSGLSLGGEISPSIGKLKNLRSLDMKLNDISGQIPDEIGNCESLRSLDISFNAIEGDIPFSISKLKQLEEINLKNNKLSGPIPSTLSQLPNLKILDLAQNFLSGEIPALIYWMEVLQYLGLRANFLTGGLSPEICRLTSLWYFDVHNNNLTGPIPESIGNCSSFQVLDLAYNQFSGEIPFNIGFLQIATLSLQGNKLTGRIPEVLGLMQALAVLDLSFNELTGPIPAILGNLSYTGKMYVHGNKLSGHIPPELGNMSNLSYLQINNNNLTGQIPPELGKLQGLFELNLSGNKLEGPIPKNISSCISLTYFNVHGNRLNGTIPSEFEKLDSLTYLNLSMNHFSGRIPRELGGIRNLDTLDLSSNNITGIIPNSIGDLEHLLILDVSGNKIAGFIPVEFGNLRSILSMDLSYNKLSGPLPPQLGELQSLDTLSLNNNNLSGEIPLELANCFSLTFLNLSYNNLSGEVPAIKNFTKFPAQSFLGNLQLCGEQAGHLCEGIPRVTSGSRSRFIIGLVCSLATSLIFLIGYFIWKANEPKEFVKSSSKPSQGSTAPPRIVILHMDLAVHSYDDVMRLTDNLSEKCIIGVGASSSVYKCTLKNGRQVAIKKLYNSHKQNLREFETELATVGRIKHRNLASLLGYSLSPHGNLLLYDYMENGSLWDVLHGFGSKKAKLDWDARIKIAVGAAQGLEYLHHNCNPRIVHRDIKTSNILLDENFEAHLSDFGIAKSISASKTHTSTYVMGTIGYIDPEYARTSRLNEKSDVYSFGVVLLELLTGRKAVDNEINLHQWVLAENELGMVREIIDSEVKSTCVDMVVVNKAMQLALLCTKRQPSARPTMQEIVRVLLSLIPAGKEVVSQSRPGVVGQQRYLDEYANTTKREKNPVDDSNGSSTSGGHLFAKFEQVISQSTH